MNVSLPDQMKAWVETQADSGRYGNASDYVRDLIRRDQQRQEKIAEFQRLVDEGRASESVPERSAKFARRRANARGNSARWRLSSLS